MSGGGRSYGGIEVARIFERLAAKGAALRGLPSWVWLPGGRPARIRFRLEAELELPGSLERVFAFFSDASHLEAITPPWLRFAIRTPLPIEMRAGAQIEYRLRLRGVPLRWRSEISVWEPPRRFVDEQKQGPYRLWRHEHIFTESAGRVRVQDRVAYAVPGGRLAHELFVRRELERIFAYRQAELDRRLGPATRPLPSVRMRTVEED